nr:MAG TPA: hypothetical protein [Bacteriophage sp.]
MWKSQDYRSPQSPTPTSKQHSNWSMQQPSEKRFLLLATKNEQIPKLRNGEQCLL